MRNLLPFACIISFLLIMGCISQSPQSTVLSEPIYEKNQTMASPIETLVTSTKFPTPTTENNKEGESKVICPSGQEPCGTNCFNPSSSSCCMGNIIPTLGIKECNGTCYDYYHQDCCLGHIYEGKWKTCNGICYNIGKMTCINGTLYEGQNIMFCGNNTYNSKTESCYKGNIIVQGLNPIPCGNTFCTNGNECCGSVCYNPEHQWCMRKF